MKTQLSKPAGSKARYTEEYKNEAAMEAGVSDHVWSLDEIIALLSLHK